jgi:hypothetical protein
MLCKDAVALPYDLSTDTVTAITAETASLVVAGSRA